MRPPLILPSQEIAILCLSPIIVKQAKTERSICKPKKNPYIMKRLALKIGQWSLAASVVLVGLSACSEDEDPAPGLNIPSSYDASNFSQNSQTERALVDQLNALTAEAKRGRDSANSVSRRDLEQLFEAGKPSLSQSVTSYFGGKLEGDGDWFDELAKASGKRWTPAAPSGNSEGGAYGGYLFDENGLEIEQLVEKGQFNASLYNHAVKLMSGPIDLATADQLVAIFGATPSFANSGSSNVAEAQRDRAMANYGARRDKNEGNDGLYRRIQSAFITLQAAIKGGSEFNQQRDRALGDIAELWEKINAATVINYCHTPIRVLSGTNLSENEIGGALHAIAEGIGFIQGLKTINPQYRIISDAQIDQILQRFNAPADGQASVYRFATDPAAELAKLQEIIDQLQVIYDFSDAQIEDFKSNWVSSQGR